MRKHIFTILAFLGLFVLSGCGSDNISNGSDSTSTDQIEATLNEMQINGDTFDLNISLTKKVDDSYQIELSNFNLTTDSCALSQVPNFTPDGLIMDGGINSHAILNITGTFDQNCNGTVFTLSATQTSTKDDQVDIRMFSVTYSTDTAPYVLQAVPSAIDISTDDTSKVLDLYLKDIRGNAPVAGKVITAQFIDPNNGTLDQYTATTDATGHVAFNYTRPETFTVGDTFDIIFEVADGTVPKSVTVDVRFVKASFDYALVNTTTPLLITYRGMEEEISVYVVDDDNVGVPGKTVTITTIADGNGRVDRSTALTDASGKATFNYTAPDDLTGLVGTSTVATLSFTENDTTISDDVTIVFSSEAIISDYSLVNPRSTVDINPTNPIAILDIQLIHTIGGIEIPVIDARPCSIAENTVTIDCIIPQVIDRGYGRITDVINLYNNDGYVYFSYIGPNSNEAINGIYSFEVYYIDENGEIAATNSLSVNIDFP